MVNYVSHSLSPTIEPVANLCASGVLERFPKIRFATIEAGIGWVPWLLDAMDGVPVRMLSQAAARRNITLVIRAADLAAVLTRLHHHFFGVDEQVAAEPAGR